VTENAAPAATSKAGSSISFSATAAGCAHPLYQFWVLAPGSHTWQILQTYSSTATFTWNTGGLPAGSYLYTVWVRDAASAGAACSSLGCEDAFYPATTYALS
jgi:hypothetical protein